MNNSVATTNRTAIAALIGAVLAGPAMAADLRAPLPPIAPVYMPLYNWTGFYIGVNGGGGWGTSSHTSLLAAATTGNFNVSGGLLGGTIGYNYQVGAWVWGVESDLAWSNIRGSTTVGATSFGTDLRWFGTVRGRVGIASDRFLPYVTGGLAYGNVRGTIAGPVNAAGYETKAGWTIGAGLEYAILPRLSVKGEYLYADLGTTTPFAGDSVSLKTHVVRAGLNWRF